MRYRDRTLDRRDFVRVRAVARVLLLAREPRQSIDQGEDCEPPLPVLRLGADDDRRWSRL